jgi:diguanylate cyclase (GGDEF)-like protein
VSLRRITERTDATPVLLTPEEPSAVEGSACLVVLAGNELGRRYVLTAAGADLGRDAACEVAIDDSSVSRRHSRIRHGVHGFEILDLGSTNGTVVNDVRIEGARSLRIGDLIKVGRTALKFLSGSSIETDYHAEVYRLSTTDALTQIYNKRYLNGHLERELSRSLRYGRHLSIILFDIDHFKQLNDTHGHLAGDAALVEVVARVQRTIRRADTLGRFGGEEFVVIAPEVPLGRARVLAEKLRASVCEAPVRFEGLELCVSVSVGVADIEEYLATFAAVGDDGRAVPADPQRLFKLADLKMFGAKQAGRNCVVG